MAQSFGERAKGYAEGGQTPKGYPMRKPGRNRPVGPDRFFAPTLMEAGMLASRLGTGARKRPLRAPDGTVRGWLVIGRARQYRTPAASHPRKARTVADVRPVDSLALPGIVGRHPMACRCHVCKPHTTYRPAE